VKKPAAKSASKTASKSSSKSAKSAGKNNAKQQKAKPAAKAKATEKADKKVKSKSLLKSVGEAAKKLLSKEKTPEAAKAAKAPVEPKTLKSLKKEKPGKKKKEKKGKEGFDLEDDLLDSDEEIGSEEIPDLSEFDENETEEESLDDGSETEAAMGEYKPSSDDEVILTDADGRRYCRVRECDQAASVEGYCRYHYLLLWKRIQVRRKILADGKLERYVEELTSRYPDKFLEMIRKDLRTEKEFLNAIAELEIDESAGDSDFEDEAQNFIDEVRGITTDSGMSDEEEF